MRPFPAIALLLALPGCSIPEPAPLDPVKSEAGFRNRSLSSPNLHAFLERALSHELHPFPPPGWSLDQLTLVAFFFHPELDVARARLKMAEARAVTAGAPPNPSLGVGVLHNLDAVRGTSPWTYGFDLEWPLEWPGKRSNRLAGAVSRAEAERAALAWAAWRVRSRLRRALIEDLLLRETLPLARAEADARSEEVKRLEALLAAGAASRPVVEAARFRLAETRRSVSRTSGLIPTARVGVAEALGVPLSAVADATFVWGNLESLPEEKDLPIAKLKVSGLLNRLDIRKLLFEYDAAEADIRLEAARRYPNVRLGPGYEWEEGDLKLGLGFSVTLPIFNRNEGPIAEALARRAEVAARFEELQARVTWGLDRAITRYRAARAEVAAIDALLAAARTSEEAAKRAVEAGQEDRLTLISHRVRIASAGKMRLDALKRALLTLGEIEDELHRPVFPETPWPEVHQDGPWANPPERKRP